MVDISSLNRIRENLCRGPLGWKKLSHWRLGRWALLDEISACPLSRLSIPSFLGCALRISMDENRSNGPSFRLGGDSYSSKSSIVKLTIEIKVYREKGC